MSVVVLASGGVDSGVLVHRAHAAGELAGLVFAHYGQPASLCEWKALQKLRTHLGTDAPVLELQLTTVWCKAMQAPSGVAGARVVPHRNLIMLSHALNWAEYLGADRVWYGAIRDDRENYADCRPEFWLGLNTANRAYSGRHQNEHQPAQVEAPLGAMGKAEVMAEAEAAGILPLCWSCYAPTPDGRPCNWCDSCNQRGPARAA